MRRTVYPLLAVVFAALAVPAVRHWREQPPVPAPPPEPLRGAWLPDESVDVGAGSAYPFGLALAPNGRRLAYPAVRAGLVSLWLQDLATGETRALPSTDGAAAPFWSPDGARLGFLAAGRLRAFDLTSGAVSDLAEAPAGRGAAWNQAGDLVFAPGADGLMHRSSDGVITSITTVDRRAGESAHGWPAFLPDGRHVAFLVTATERSRAGIWVISLDAAAPRVRVAASDAQPLVVGASLLVLNDTTLVAQPLDSVTWAAAGRTTLVGFPAGRGPLGQLFATATADVLIYGAPGSILRELRWVSRDGQTLGRAGEPAESWELRIAPDGRRVAVTALDPQLRTFDVWIRDGQAVPLRLSLGTDLDESAVWSPNGFRVAWVGKRRNILIRGAGALLPEQTAATFAPPVQLWDWSHDGAHFLLGRTDPQTRDDLWVVPQAEGAKPSAYAAAEFNQTHGAFSRDGRWVAYASDESGQFDIYLDSFPKPGSRIRVTTAGGIEPRWKSDGRELYFRRGSEVHVVRFAAAGATLTMQSIDRLFDAGAPIRAFDVSPDGARFLLNLPARDAAPRSATMVMHWQRAPADPPKP